MTGTRNNELYESAKDLFRSGASSDEVLRKLRELNASFIEPLPDTEVMTLVRIAEKGSAQ